VRTSSSARAGLAALVLALSTAIVPACTCSRSGDGSLASSSASAQASSAKAGPPADGAPPAASGPDRSSPDLGVHPVYPALTGPPNPLAERLCDALHGLPGRRRGECCSSPPAPGIAGECVRNLTGALASGAVTVASTDVDRCLEATTLAHAGCDWVAPFPRDLPPPPACLGIVKGTLKVGAGCRSSLECGQGARCLGAGPTTPGRCGPPAPVGPCGSAVDVLAIYTRQDNFAQEHPDCVGFCSRGRCEPFVAAGSECKFNGACGPNAHCEKGRCAPGEHGKLGEKCLGTRCAPGLHCVKETCIAPRREGDACDEDGECRGTCVHDADGAGGGSGRCKASCVASPRPALSARPRVPRPH
jgi:hypothetical protein